MTKKWLERKQGALVTHGFGLAKLNERGDPDPIGIGSATGKSAFTVFAATSGSVDRGGTSDGTLRTVHLISNDLSAPVV